MVIEIFGLSGFLGPPCRPRGHVYFLELLLGASQVFHRTWYDDNVIGCGRLQLFHMFWYESIGLFGAVSAPPYVLLFVVRGVP